MATTSEKEAGYQLLLLQLAGLLEMEQHPIASLGNASAALRDLLPATIFSGFYLYENGELILGPFQGSVSCTRIALGKGVCGEAAAKNETLIVDDVTQHANYIACDSRARSEIVVPMYRGEQLLGVLDLDAGVTNCYDEIDKKYLNQVAELLVAKLAW